MFRNIRLARLVSIIKEKQTMPIVLALLLFGLVLAALFMRKPPALHAASGTHVGARQGKRHPTRAGTRPVVAPRLSASGLNLELQRRGVDRPACWAFRGRRSSRRRPRVCCGRPRESARISTSPSTRRGKIVEKDQSRTGMPAGVSSLGAIPLAVGLAYLVFYFTDDSRKRLAAGAPSESFTPRS